MHFRKMHGAGNDFIVVSGLAATVDQDWPTLARKLCARSTSVGADGLVLSTVIDTTSPALEIRCFNADGSTATMCGNALRCAARCAQQDHGIREMNLLMAGVKHQASIAADGVWVTAEVGDVTLRRVSAVFNGRPFWFDEAHTGTEHVVGIVDDVDAVDAVVCGRLIRHHEDLAPLGTNVNFIQSAGDQALKIRTYERGVEAETLSCGSGAVAAVVIATRRGLVADRQVTVHNRSGTPLMVRPHEARRGKAYWIGGPVTHTYWGELA
ncbi:diaminopimelate epimerase [Actinacidiphila glaucinigra]|uniref:diaminopimelate epimerase n=1 Tax=Actinacidiphila glaucinigra TaxID=235986 RepID=UPI002DD9ECFD|nr:diaminopimelate epimerase [Actinacidiphila glaucinigra]WSD65092.1 diaminopimelate epimerase [Actinacidiphila glaucinigra]